MQEQKSVDKRPVTRPRRGDVHWYTVTLDDGRARDTASEWRGRSKLEAYRSYLEFTGGIMGTTQKDFRIERV